MLWAPSCLLQCIIPWENTPMTSPTKEFFEKVFKLVAITIVITLTKYIFEKVLKDNRIYSLPWSLYSHLVITLLSSLII